MNPVREIWLIVEREIRKNLRSAKGIVMLSLSLLGALACTFRLPKFEEVIKKSTELSPEELHMAKAKLFSEFPFFYGDATGERIADAPIKLVLLFVVAVWLAPLLVAIIGFDGVASDLQYKSVRYWTVRTRRSSYYIGKFLGLWAIISMITLVMQMLIWTVTIFRAEATAGTTLEWGLRFWVVSLPISAAWCGIATLVGSFFRTPFLALLITCAVFFALFFLGFIIGRGGDIEWLRYFYPNSYDAWILSPKAGDAMKGIGLGVAFAALTTAAGSLFFARRDV